MQLVYIGEESAAGQNKEKSHHRADSVGHQDDEGHSFSLLAQAGGRRDSVPVRPPRVALVLSTMKRGTRI